MSQSNRVIHGLLSLGCILCTNTLWAGSALKSQASEPLNSTILQAQDTYLAEANKVVYCLVVNIQRGQLAVRSAPGGRSVAGLNNDNVVRFIRRREDQWAYVEVVEGPNSRVNGIQGWVNLDYLECIWD